MTKLFGPARAPGKGQFVSKTALAVLALLGMMALSRPAAAQLIPHGNLYAGVSYGQLTEAVNQQSYRGWNGSAEVIPFARYTHLGFVVDGSGFYRNNEFSSVKTYNLVGGVRLSATYGKWRPFVHGMGGIQQVDSSGITYRHGVIDIGGGADYKIFFKNFSWRLQGDFMHSSYANATQNDYRASTGIVWRF